jgi:hypothetical protein
MVFFIDSTLVIFHHQIMLGNFKGTGGEQEAIWPEIDLRPRVQLQTAGNEVQVDLRTYSNVTTKCTVEASPVRFTGTSENSVLNLRFTYSIPTSCLHVNG